ncbi:toxin-antitoxin system YwqK family antitoxin [Ferruginibacter sp.]
MKIYQSLLTFFIICITFCNNVTSQNTDLKFYDIIRDDSIVMYFNESYNFTEQKCAQNRRYTRIDSFGDFSKSFIDLNTLGNVIGRGNYNEGSMEGYFEVFYSNGQIKCNGKYKNGSPIGEWFYFYPDGKIERKLLINVADTFLIDFYKPNGEQTVNGGKGFFDGEVFGNDRFFNTKIMAKGEVVNGKPEGKWLSYLRSNPYCTEYYKNGVFDYGNFSSVMEKNKKYTGKSYLNKYFLSSYIESLDQFKTAQCYDYKDDTVVNTQSKNNTKLELNNFRSFVNDAIGAILQRDFRNGDYSEYQQGSNLFKLSFKVKTDGSPMDFKKLTSWGDQYFNPVTNALSMHAKFPAFDRVIYFHLIVIKSPSNTVSYQYKFSNDSDDGF